MLKNRSGRRGFTLPEVLVTVAIVAVLAAVVVPAVTQQIGKGDDASITSSMSAVRTGVTAFVSDTRKFPGRLVDLYAAPLDTDDDAFGVDYGTNTAARWRGPYQTGAHTAGDSIDVVFGFLRDSVNVTSNQMVVYFGIPGETVRAKVDTLLDGATGAATGNMTWTATASDTTVLFRLMPAR